jgi:hypothetical protein
VDAGTGVGALSFKLARYNVAGNGVLTSPVGIDGTSVSVAPSFGTAGTGATTFTVNVKAAADVAAGEVVISSATKSATTGIYTLDSGTGSGTGSSSAGINYGTHKSVDLRRIVGSAPTILNNDGTTLSTRPYATVAGTVNSASTSTYGGVAVPGSAVTISGAGQMFAANQDGADIYGDGSLTVVADNSGQFSFKVWSHKAGAQTVTVKSGAGTASIKLYFAVAAEADAATATVVVADGASQFQAGRALDVTVTVADVFGNPVALDATWAANTDAKLTIKQTGAGYLTNTGDVVVGSTGVYTTKLITNAGDLGTSTITATIDFYDAVNLTDVVATKSSEFGVTDADVTVGGRAVYASVEFAKGKTVTVSVDGKRLYSKLFSTDAYTELKFTQKTAGKHVVTVRVSGGIVYSETVTTTK